MSETLEITKQKAIQTYDDSSKKEKQFLERLFGKKTFQKDVMGRIKTIEDILEDNGITKDEFEEYCNGLPEDEISYRLIKMLCKSLNEGWTPDWDDSKQYKYFPWFKMGSSGFRLTTTFAGLRLRLSALAFA